MLRKLVPVLTFLTLITNGYSNDLASLPGLGVPTPLTLNVPDEGKECIPNSQSMKNNYHQELAKLKANNCQNTVFYIYNLAVDLINEKNYQSCSNTINSAFNHYDEKYKEISKDIYYVLVYCAYYQGLDITHAKKDFEYIVKKYPAFSPGRLLHDKIVELDKTKNNIKKDQERIKKGELKFSNISASEIFDSILDSINEIGQLQTDIQITTPEISDEMYQLKSEYIKKVNDATEDLGIDEEQEDDPLTKELKKRKKNSKAVRTNNFDELGRNKAFWENIDITPIGYFGHYAASSFDLYDSDESSWLRNNNYKTVTNSPKFDMSKFDHINIFTIQMKAARISREFPDKVWGFNLVTRAGFSPELEEFECVRKKRCQLQKNRLGDWRLVFPNKNFIPNKITYSLKKLADNYRFQDEYPIQSDSAKTGYYFMPGLNKVIAEKKVDTDLLHFLIQKISKYDSYKDPVDRYINKYQGQQRMTKLMHHVLRSPGLPDHLKELGMDFDQWSEFLVYLLRERNIPAVLVNGHTLKNSMSFFGLGLMSIDRPRSNSWLKIWIEKEKRWVEYRSPVNQDNKIKVARIDRNVPILNPDDYKPDKEQKKDSEDKQGGEKGENGEDGKAGEEDEQSKLLREMLESLNYQNDDEQQNKSEDKPKNQQGEEPRSTDYQDEVSSQANEYASADDSLKAQKKYEKEQLRDLSKSIDDLERYKDKSKSKVLQLTDKIRQEYIQLIFNTDILAKTHSDNIFLYEKSLRDPTLNQDIYKELYSKAQEFYMLQLEEINNFLLKPKFNPITQSPFYKIELKHKAGLLEIYARQFPRKKQVISSLINKLNDAAKKTFNNESFYHTLAESSSFQIVIAKDRAFLKSPHTFLYKDLGINLKNYPSYKLGQISHSGGTYVLAVKEGQNWIVLKDGVRIKLPALKNIEDIRFRNKTEDLYIIAKDHNGSSYVYKNEKKILKGQECNVNTNDNSDLIFHYCIQHVGANQQQVAFARNGKVVHKNGKLYRLPIDTNINYPIDSLVSEYEDILFTAAYYNGDKEERIQYITNLKSLQYAEYGYDEKDTVRLVKSLDGVATFTGAPGYNEVNKIDGEWFKTNPMTVFNIGSYRSFPSKATGLKQFQLQKHPIHTELGTTYVDNRFSIRFRDNKNFNFRFYSTTSYQSLNDDLTKYLYKLDKGTSLITPFPVLNEQAEHLEFQSTEQILVAKDSKHFIQTIITSPGEVALLHDGHAITRIAYDTADAFDGRWGTVFNSPLNNLQYAAPVNIYTDKYARHSLTVKFENDTDGEPEYTYWIDGEKFGKGKKKSFRIKDIPGLVSVLTTKGNYSFIKEEKLTTKLARLNYKLIDDSESFFKKAGKILSSDEKVKPHETEYLILNAYEYEVNDSKYTKDHDDNSTNQQTLDEINDLISKMTLEQILQIQLNKGLVANKFLEKFSDYKKNAESVDQTYLAEIAREIHLNNLSEVIYQKMIKYYRFGGVSTTPSKDKRIAKLQLADQIERTLVKEIDRLRPIIK